MKAQEFLETNSEFSEYITYYNPIDYVYLEKSLEAYPTKFKELLLMYLKSEEESFNVSNLQNISFEESQNESLRLMLIAINQFKNDNTTEGVRLLEKALKIDESNKWANLELFKYYIEVDQPQAFGFLENAIKIDPKFSEAILIRSMYYDPIDNCQEIIDDIQRIESTYDDYRRYYWLGTALMNCGKENKAKENLIKSVEKFKSQEGLLALAQYYTLVEKDLDKADSLFRESYYLNPNNLNVLIDYGWFLYDRNEYERAEEMFLKALDLDNDQEIYNQLIQFYLSSKNFKDAEAYIDKSLQVNGRNFMNEGYRILLLSLKGIDNSGLSKEYKNSYDEFEINWLKSILVQFYSNKEF